jgi:predicted SnoaL-like aldol condensation-catalyzing enzyme
LWSAGFVPDIVLKVAHALDHREDHAMRRTLIAFAVAAAAAVTTLHPALAADEATLEANKKIVVEFYEAAINQKDFEAASKFMGDRYIQHNPLAADGHEGLEGFLGYLRENHPDARSEIKQVFAEDDYVILHVHAVREPGQRGSAIVDIFRLEDGKVVEHWDVIQPIPEQPANDNGMF